MNKDEMQSLISGMSIDAVIKEYEEAASISMRMLVISAFLDNLNLEHRFDLQTTTNIETGEEELSEEALIFYDFCKQVKIVQAKAEALHLLALPIVSPIDGYDTTIKFDIKLPSRIAQISDNIIVGVTNSLEEQEFTPNIRNNVENFKELARKRSFPILEEINRHLWGHVFSKNKNTLEWDSRNPFSEIIFAADAKIKLAAVLRSTTTIKNTPVEEWAQEQDEEMLHSKYDDLRSSDPSRLSSDNLFSLEINMRELQDFIPYMDEKIDALGEVFSKYSGEAFIRFITGDILSNRKR